ncbi:MAG: Gfo/Idh/MocA family oxidoreductase, partial [bacterium]|nr:Gfo/Idh/MocA family oxidoreductase [bacterium]
SDEVRIGVIGCGGRGTGAAVNALEAHESTRIVALADLFGDRLNSSAGELSSEDSKSQFGDRGVVAESRRYTGFNAYKQLLAESDINVVILATSPHFRPIHFAAAIEAGKHVFMEKPVAVDPAGVRKVIEAGALADTKNLSVVSGTQRRHESSYLAAMERIRGGDIGDAVSARCYWNQGGLWVHNRKPEYSDIEWQCRNWLYFTWLSGDHICEQHIHNLDVVNWAMNANPVRCLGLGGRQVRTGEEYGNIFDHFAIEYEYPGGKTMTSMCRQIEGTPGRCEETIVGTKGSITMRSGGAEIKNGWKFSGKNRNPYVQEHVDLLASVRGDGTHLNEAKRVAESTLTAIMGRMSCYTGQEVTWDQAMKSSLDLSPKAYEFGDHPVAPVSVPGKTKLV